MNADLVLLDANPITDITNTRRIRAVIMRGQLLDRVKLDEMLARVESSFARPALESVGKPSDVPAGDRR